MKKGDAKTTDAKPTDGSHREDVRRWLGFTDAPVCCYTCLHYHANGGYCDKHEDTPPVEFRESGCEEWREGAPF